MTTARERMLDLSPLPSGNSARAHFLAITKGSGVVYGEVEVFMESDVESVIEVTDVVGTLESDIGAELELDITAEIE